MQWLTKYYRAFIAGGIAACGAVTVTHPFETVKIRYDCDCTLLPISGAEKRSHKVTATRRITVKARSTTTLSWGHPWRERHPQE